MDSEPPQPGTRHLTGALVAYAATLCGSSAWGDSPGAAPGSNAYPMGLLWALALTLGAAIFCTGESAIGLIRRSGPAKRMESLLGADLFTSLARFPAGALCTMAMGKYACLLGLGLGLARGFWVSLESPGARIASIFILLAGWGLMLLVGEIIPRSLPSSFALRVACAASPLFWLAHAISWPLRLAIRPAARPSVEVGEDPQGALPMEESLKSLLRTGLVNVALDEEQKEMIEGVFDLRESTATEIMTPRAQVEAYPATLSQEQMLDSLRRSSHSRTPIYEDSLDRIAGVLHVKEVLLTPERDYHELLRPPLVTPPDRLLSELLRDFLRHRTHLAVTLDVFGGMAGIVTLHDILEEIVGDMVDPSAGPETAWRPLGGGRVRMSGAHEMDDLRERLGIAFPDGVARTVGGFITNSLGRAPVVGMILRHEGYEFEAMRVSQRKIDLVEARPVVEKPPIPSGGKAAEPSE